MRNEHGRKDRLCKIHSRSGNQAKNHSTTRVTNQCQVIKELFKGTIKVISPWKNFVYVDQNLNITYMLFHVCKDIGLHLEGILLPTGLSYV